MLAEDKFNERSNNNNNNNKAKVFNATHKLFVLLDNPQPDNSVFSS